MKTHVVQPGDCMASLAFQYGFRDAMWLHQHASNSGLREIRPSPDLLHPGDIVNLPDLRPNTKLYSVDRTHRFQIKAPRKRLRLRFLFSNGNPIANAPYELRYGAKIINGNSSAGGEVDVAIPVNVFEAEISLEGIRRQVMVGHLNPMRSATDSGLSGAQSRLSNLGYGAGTPDGVLGPRTKLALMQFQEAEGLTVTGELNAATVDALEHAHGC
jgi:hypothetical protein